MATKREWLIEQGKAQAGRGKFSKEAHELLAAAEAAGVVFDDNTPVKSSKPKVSVGNENVNLSAQEVAGNVAAAAHPVPSPDSYDAKAVRVWAGQNGHNVGARGRIDREVISAYLAVNPKADRPQVSIGASDAVHIAPRTYFQDKFSAVVNGKLFSTSFKTGCANCGFSLGYCQCGSPSIFLNGSAVKVAVSPVS